MKGTNREGVTMPGDRDTIQLRQISDDIRETFYALAEEYLPDSNYDKVHKREQDYKKAYLALCKDEQVIGVIFGWPRRLDAPEDESFCIDGLAVREPFQGHGYGSKLIKVFEAAAREYGFERLSVGSAGGYVEHFYIKNGFQPKEYKAFGETGIYVEKTFENLRDYETYKRKNPDGFVVLEK